MSSLEATIGYRFKEHALLETALTHSSYANESKQRVFNNERLEFLGDSVLSVVVAEHLFRAGKRLPEGELTRRRAALVCEAALADFARQIHLGDYLRLGKGEEMNGGRQRPSILSDAFEALIAAVYLDGGLPAAQRFILPFIAEGAVEAADYKTRLQEVVQQDRDARLLYRVTGEDGPDHDKQFAVEVLLGEKPLGAGTGHSKKLAEQAAARRALEQMGLEPAAPPVGNQEED